MEINFRVRRYYTEIAVAVSIESPAGQRISQMTIEVSSNRIGKPGDGVDGIHHCIGPGEWDLMSGLFEHRQF